jgi:hypothetical protein
VSESASRRRAWLVAGALLGAVGLGALYRPPLAWWARWAGERYGVADGLVLAVIHAETRGVATGRRVEATTRQLIGGGDVCARALSLGERRYPRDRLAGLLFAGEVVGGVRRGVNGADGLGLAYATAGGDPGCEVALPGDDEGERQGASFARFWRASARRALPERKVKAIVLHVTDGTLASAVAWFRRPGAGTSAHYAVRASDGLVVQMVDEREVAFHDACFNDETIGVEHEGYTSDGGRWFSEEMYRASARLVRDIAARHQIPLDREHIVGHDSAPDCSEHKDPGASWSWGLYWRLLRGEEGARGG